MNSIVTARSETYVTVSARPLWFGMVIGTILPVVSGLVFATYDLAARPIIVQTAQLCSYTYLLGEIALIIYAISRRLDVWSIVRAMPPWSKTALAVFLSTFWISSLTVSRYPGSSFVLGIAWLIHLLFAAALYHLMREVPLRALNRIWPGFILGLVALTIMIVVHFTILPPELVGKEHGVDWKVAIPGFINVRLFGSWSGAIFAAVLGRIWTMPDHHPAQRHYYCAVSLAFALTFWTTTRAALLAGVCILPIALFLVGRPRAAASWTILPFYLLGGILLTLPLQPYNDPSYTFLEANNFTSVDGFATGRLSYWTALLEIGMEHPIFGSGMISSRWLYPPFYIHPHNALVEFFINWGIIGTVSLITLIIGAAIYAHRALENAPELLPFILMFDCLVIESLFDGMFHFAQFIIMMLGCLAICLGKVHTTSYIK